jgi:hypothetical protein
MMPSNRRVKAIFLVVAIFVLLTLYISASARQTRSSDFYTKTQDALSTSRHAKEADLAESEVATGEDEMVKQRLKAAEEAAKEKAAKKAEDYHGQEAKQRALKVAESLRDDPEGDKVESKNYVAPKSSKSSKTGTGKKELEKGEKSVAGRVIMKDPKEAVLKSQGDVKHAGDDEDDEDEDVVRGESEDEQKAHEELAEILKKSPSMSVYHGMMAPALMNRSHHLFQELLPVLEESETHPSPEIYDNTTTIRSRARPTSPRPSTANLPRRSHRSQDGPQHPDPSEEHWRRRRRARPRRERKAHRHRDQNGREAHEDLQGPDGS